MNNLPVICWKCTDKCTQERHNMNFIIMALIVPVVLILILVGKALQTK